MTDYNWQIDGRDMFETFNDAWRFVLITDADSMGNDTILSKHHLTFIGKGDWKQKLYAEEVEKCRENGESWLVDENDLKSPWKEEFHAWFPTADAAMAASVSGKIEYQPGLMFESGKRKAEIMHIEGNKRPRKVNPRSLQNLKRGALTAP